MSVRYTSPPPIRLPDAAVRVHRDFLVTNTAADRLSARRDKRIVSTRLDTMCEEAMGWFTRERETAPCTVEISHCFESLHAHLRLDNGAVIHPGDEVLVHGPEIMAPYGEVVSESRTATITRATPWQRLWTRATGDLEFMELCEFSFSEEVMPS